MLKANAENDVSSADHNNIPRSSVESLSIDANRSLAHDATS